MNIKRNYNTRKMPGLNTASLPDLIFTVLFFFMIVTNIREVTVKLRFREPQGVALKKLVKKSSIIHLYVGKAADSPKHKEAPYQFQLNDRLVSLDEIGKWVAQERASMSEDEQKDLTISLKADTDVPMQLIMAVKQELRKANALRINYAATEAPKVR